MQRDDGERAVGDSESEIQSYATLEVVSVIKRLKVVFEYIFIWMLSYSLEMLTFRQNFLNAFYMGLL